MDNPRHLIDILKYNCDKAPHAIAFHFFDSQANNWLEITWDQYRTKVYNVAQLLISHSIKRGDRVAIISANRPEWIISDLAIQAIGAISIPIFSTATPQDVNYIIEHSGAKAIFFDQEQKLKNIQLPSDFDQKCLFCFDRGDLNETKAEHSDSTFSLADIKSTDLATIVYTSGTTGIPKGVMHTHGNFIAAAQAIKNAINEGKSDKTDVFFSFLPLSHVAERALVEIGSLITGSPVVFARRVDTFIEDAILWKPTILLCVPRLWEKVYDRINSGLKTAPLLRRLAFNTALKLGQRRIVGTCIYKKKDANITSKIADTLVGNALKKRLGFDKVRLFLTGSAPTRPELIKFFGSLGIYIREVYGLTENLCLGHYVGIDEIRLTSCGRAFHGNEVKIGSDGEVFFKAPWNFKGFYKDEKSTLEALSKDGWLSTGDLGYLDPDGYLFITGRKKELLKTSNGKYVAPVPIEDDIKSYDFIEDAIVIGEGYKYCIALVSLSSSERQNMSVSETNLKLEHLLEAVNHSRARHEQIKKIGVLKSSFSVEAGLLTPSMKLKRKSITAHYEQFLQQLYRSDQPVLWE